MDDDYSFAASSRTTRPPSRSHHFVLPPLDCPHPRPSGPYLFGANQIQGASNYQSDWQRTFFRRQENTLYLPPDSPQANISDQTLILQPSQDVSQASTSSQAHARQTKDTNRVRWSDGEVTILMNVYRQEYKSKKKGKSLEAMWGKIAERVNHDSKEINSFLGEKSSKHCRDKMNNLNKKYKKVKDQSRRTGEGSDDIKGFPEFGELDEIWGTRDAVSPKFVIEAGTSSPVQQDSKTNGSPESAISSPGSPNQSIGEEATQPLQEEVTELNEPEEELGSPLAASSRKKESKKNPRRGKKRSKSTYEEDEDEDSYAELLKAQRQLLKSREEERRELFAYLKESDSQNQNLILSAIRELGGILKQGNPSSTAP